MAKDNNYFLTGVIIGGVIGGLTILAFSPKVGKDFRQTFKKRISLLKEKAWQQNDILPQKGSEERVARKGIPLVQYVKPIHNKEKAGKLEQSIDKIVDNTTNGTNTSMTIERILADTEKAFLNVEQKYNK